MLITIPAALLLFAQGLALPPDSAPEQLPAVEAAGLITHAEGAFEGYTLLAPLGSKATYLLDMQGEVVHEWPSEYTPGNSAYLLDDGSLMRTGRVDNDIFSGGGQGGRIQRIAWDGELLWDYDLSTADALAHHDIEPLPNGNVLAIAWEAVGPDELFRAGRRFEAIGDGGLWPDFVVELAPRPTEEDLGGAEVVWEWHAFDHLVQGENEQAANFGDAAELTHRIDVNAGLRTTAMTAEEARRAKELEEEMRGLGYTGDDEPSEGEDGEEQTARPHGGGGGTDWLHTNSIDYLPGEDLILLSSRTLSEVWVIDHSTTTAEAATGEGGRRGRGGDLVWRWGNPATHGGTGEQQLFGQHDARWIAGGEGLRVMVYNNGEGRPGGGDSYSTVEVIELPELGGAADAGPASPARTIGMGGANEAGPSFFSSFISGAQALPNGNVLICSGAESRLIEVNASDEVVWEWRSDLPGAQGARGPRGRRPGGSPGPGGRPLRGERPERPEGPPPGGFDRGPGGPDGPGAGGGRPGGGGNGSGLFRATRLSADHPGLVGLKPSEGE